MYPENSIELTSGEVLDFHYAVGKVMHARHGRQLLETVPGEPRTHKFINDILIVKHVQLHPAQVTRLIPLADDPKPEVFPEDSKLNLVERIGRYCFVNWCKVTEIVQECVLGIVSSSIPGYHRNHPQEPCGLIASPEFCSLFSWLGLPLHQRSSLMSHPLSVLGTSLPSVHTACHVG